MTKILSDRKTTIDTSVAAIDENESETALPGFQPAKTSPPNAR